ANQSPDIATAHQLSGPPAYFPCAQRREEPNARGVPPMDVWHLALVTAQQPQMGGERQRPDNISEVLERVRRPRSISQCQSIDQRQERDHRVQSFIPV